MSQPDLSDIFAAILGEIVPKPLSRTQMLHAADVTATMLAAHHHQRDSGTKAEVAAMAALMLVASDLKGEIPLQGLYNIAMSVMHNAFVQYITLSDDTLKAAGPDHNKTCKYKAGPPEDRFHHLPALIGHTALMDVLRGQGLREFYPQHQEQITDAIDNWLPTKMMDLAGQVNAFTDFGLKEKEPETPVQ